MWQRHRDGSTSVWHDKEYLRWEPTVDGRAVKGNWGWQVVKALGAVFGPPPWEFTQESIMQLEAMQAASEHDEYGEIIEAVREHGSIRMWSPKWEDVTKPHDSGAVPL